MSENFKPMPMGEGGHHLIVPGSVVDSMKPAMTPADHELRAQNEVMGVGGHGSIRADSDRSNEVRELEDRAIHDMLNPENILDLKSSFDKQAASKREEEPFAGNVLDKDGERARARAAKEAELKEDLIEKYTQTGTKEDETREVPETVKSDIRRLMDLSYDELERRAEEAKEAAPDVNPKADIGQGESDEAYHDPFSAVEVPIPEGFPGPEEDEDPDLPIPNFLSDQEEAPSEEEVDRPGQSEAPEADEGASGPDVIAEGIPEQGLPTVRRSNPEAAADDDEKKGLRERLGDRWEQLKNRFSRGGNRNEEGGEGREAEKGLTRRRKLGLLLGATAAFSAVAGAATWDAIDKEEKHGGMPTFLEQDYRFSQELEEAGIPDDTSEHIVHNQESFGRMVNNPESFDRMRDWRAGEIERRMEQVPEVDRTPELREQVEAVVDSGLREYFANRDNDQAEADLDDLTS